MVLVLVSVCFMLLRTDLHDDAPHPFCNRTVAHFERISFAFSLSLVRQGRVEWVVDGCLSPHFCTINRL